VVEHTKVSLYAASCTRLNVHDTFERRMQRIFFFYKDIYKIITNTTHKLKYLHTYLQTQQIFTKKTPPNLKRHIAHNVTELT
jgi:hypothetical protein